MKEVLRQHLIADSAVTGLVGKRVSWGARPRADALPSVCLHQISAERQYVMQADARLCRSRVQADCWAATYADATAVSRAVIADLSGLRDPAIRWQGVFAIDQHDIPEDATAGAEEMLYRISVDFYIWHEE